MSVDINDCEAKILLQMKKHYMDSGVFSFTGLGEALRIPLFSDDCREEFMLDITRSQISIKKQRYKIEQEKLLSLLD